MIRRLIGKGKPHKRPGTAARQERRKAARERLGVDIAAVLALPSHHVSEREGVGLVRMRDEYASLGHSLGIMETVESGAAQ